MCVTEGLECSCDHLIDKIERRLQFCNLSRKPLPNKPTNGASFISSE
jgi:hypothetical protein